MTKSPYATTPALIPPMSTNPLQLEPMKAGFQVGMAGAAAGLGLSAIHRAIRLNAGNTEPVAVFKPILLGATIGAALGAGGSYLTGKENKSKPMTWDQFGAKMDRDIRARQYKQGNNTVGDTMMETKYVGLQKIAAKAPVPNPDPLTLTKYAGLLIITEQTIHLEKRGGFKDVALGAADIGTYFIPGVGTVRMGYDALKSFGGGAKSLFKGDFRKGLGQLASGAGSALFAGMSLVPGGAAVGTAAKALRAGKFATKALKGGRGAGMAARMAKGMHKAKGVRAGLARGIGGRMTPQQLKLMSQGANKMQALGKRMPRGGKAMGGGLALSVGGGMMEGAPAGETATRAGAPAAATSQLWSRPNPYLRQQMPGLFSGGGGGFRVPREALYM